MRANFFIRLVSVFAVAMMIAGSAFAQGKGKGGGGGGGNHGGGGPPGQQRQMGGGGQGGGQGHVRQQPPQQQQPPQRQAGGGGGGWQRQQMQIQRQQMPVQQQQQQRGGWQQQQRQQMQVQRQQQMQQWQQQRQQMQAQRDSMRQQQQLQRQQRDIQVRGQREQRDAMRQQMRQQQLWQNQQRQEQARGRVVERDTMHKQMLQQRQWQAQERESRRDQLRSQPQWNRGPVRQDRQFDVRGYDDSLKTQLRIDRQGWNFARKQQRFESQAFARSERDYYRALRRQPEQFVGDSYNYSTPAWNYSTGVQPYYDYRTVNVFIGDDYSDYARSRYYNVYKPAYTAYDYYYPDTYFPIYRSYVYDEPYYGYSNGFDWKTLLFRSVIAAFFSNGDNVGYLDPYPRYTSYYDNGYYGYIPPYRYQEPYYTFGYTPTYAYYEPASYYGYDQYAYNDVPYDYVGYPSFPYNDMVVLYSGGVDAEIIQRAMATGYYQGLLEGQTARRYGWNDEYYSDPYLYEQTIYDPYSSSMGDCRRYMSEGYEMGYADALSGRDEFYLAEGGDIDLVSLLVGSTVILRS